MSIVGSPWLDAPPGSRVAVAMSGGVDSSVVAGLLVEAGYEVIGLTARLYDVDSAATRRAGSCCAPRDARDARAVAAHLGIRHYVVDERRSFERDVIAPFARAWAAGRTPNPCVDCNRHLKFDALLRRAAVLGAERLCTGHYARLIADAAGQLQLLRARDRDKDQAYFLHPLRPAGAARLRFPLGDLGKGAVRDHARRLGLQVAEKAESMDICFTGGRGPAAWLEARPELAGAGGGALVALSGLGLGRHGGQHRFTIGQRRGHGVAGGEGPLYVVGKRDDGAIVLGGRDALRVDRVVLEAAGTVDGSPPQLGVAVLAQWRHRGPLVAARWVAVDSTGPDGSDAAARWRLELDAGAEAIAPGQSLVLYDAAGPDAGERLIGGGIVAWAGQRPAWGANAEASDGDHQASAAAAPA